RAPGRRRSRTPRRFGEWARWNGSAGFAGPGRQCRAMSTPTREDQLALARQRLLEARRQGVVMPKAAVLIPPRPAGGDALPLSFAQQRLWFLDQMAGGHAFYNVPSALRLKLWLQPEVLERALQAIVQRHETL